MILALDASIPAGGAIVAIEPEGHWFFPQEAGLAVLWDLRVVAQYRRRGVGASLIEEACRVAREAGCHHLAIETQDVNVPACRLYASMGAVLREIRPRAYPEHPDEAALLWYLAIA
jgi:GNAT superfamily N-acetyltransferase